MEGKSNVENMELERLFALYKNKKVLVTGHTGFKGSWLSIWLNLLGAKVIGYALDPKTENDNFVLSGIGNHIKDYRGDIRNSQYFYEIVTKEKPEFIFHLAAQPIVLSSYQYPVCTFETNIMGTVNVLEAARKITSVKAAIIITSDKCYDNKEWIWGYRENDSMGGYDPYSASKGAAELVLSSYRSSFFNPTDVLKHGKAVSSVRAGNVIGGGDWADFRIIPDCIRALEKNEAIKVRSPQALRPWQHVLEPLGGYLLLGAKMCKDPVRFSEAWNFGPLSENIIDVKRLVEQVISFYGEGSWNDLSKPNDLHEARFLALDINKAQYRLGWKPVLNFENTIELTVDWYRKYKNQNVLDLCKEQIEFYFRKWISSKEK